MRGSRTSQTLNNESWKESHAQIERVAHDQVNTRGTTRHNTFDADTYIASGGKDEVVERRPRDRSDCCPTVAPVKGVLLPNRIGWNAVPIHRNNNNNVSQLISRRPDKYHPDQRLTVLEAALRFNRVRVDFFGAGSTCHAWFDVPKRNGAWIAIRASREKHSAMRTSKPPSSTTHRSYRLTLLSAASSTAWATIVRTAGRCAVAAPSQAAAAPQCTQMLDRH